MERRVLLVDDEPKIRAVLREYLTREHIDVTEAGSVSQARALLGLTGHQPAEPVDLVVLDLGLPDGDGLTLLGDLRRHSAVHVLILTARADEVDRVVGLEVGADDYVTKPFSAREVVARIKAVFRRLELQDAEPSDAPMIFDGLSIDPERREVRADGRLVELSALDFDLLAAMAASPGRVFSRSQLLEKVWGYDFYGDERVVDVHIRNMRRTLGDDPEHPRWVATVRGVGYKFVGNLRR